MGIFKKILKRDLTPEEQERKSQAEKEWVERNMQRGYRFAEKISLDKHINNINDFGTKYPKTFFGIIFFFLFVCIALNHLFMLSGDTGSEGQTDMKNIQQVGYTLPQDTELGQEIIGMQQELDRIDREIRGIIAKDTVTLEDSLRVRELLIKGNRLYEILNGSQQPQDTLLNPKNE